MANQEHLDILKQGTEAWNKWRKKYPDITPDLSRANLAGFNLSKSHLEGVNLSKAYLGGRKDISPKVKPAKLQGAFFDKLTNLEDIYLGSKEGGFASLADIDWNGANIALIEWSEVDMLGEENIAYQSSKLDDYKIAVRANRQVAMLLRSQGLNEEADRFAYKASVLHRQVFQRQLLQNLKQRNEQLQLLDPQGDSLVTPIVMPPITGSVSMTPAFKFFLTLVSYPTAVLIKIETKQVTTPFFKLLLLPFALLSVIYLLVISPFLLILLFLLCFPLLLSLENRIIQIWFPRKDEQTTHKKIENRIIHQIGRLMNRFSQYLTDKIDRSILKQPPQEDLRDKIIIPISLLLLETIREYRKYVFSLFLDILAGYGYRPLRTLFWYALTIFTFTLVYLNLWATSHLDKITKQSLAFMGAVVFSITAFHGRGFFLAGDFGYNSLITILAAIEAVIGLIIEISFIATFTQRFFGR